MIVRVPGVFLDHSLTPKTKQIFNFSQKLPKLERVVLGLPDLSDGSDGMAGLVKRKTILSRGHPCLGVSAIGPPLLNVCRLLRMQSYHSMVQ